MSSLPSLSSSSSSSLSFPSNSASHSSINSSSTSSSSRTSTNRPDVISKVQQVYLQKSVSQTSSMPQNFAIKTEGDVKELQNKLTLEQTKLTKLEKEFEVQNESDKKFKIAKQAEIKEKKEDQLHLRSKITSDQVILNSLVNDSAVRKEVNQDALENDHKMEQSLRDGILGMQKGVEMLDKEVQNFIFELETRENNMKILISKINKSQTQILELKQVIGISTASFVFEQTDSNPDDSDDSWIEVSRMV